MTSWIWEARLTVIPRLCSDLTRGMEMPLMRIIDTRWGSGLGRETVSRGHCGTFRRDPQETALTVAVL